MDLNFIRTNTQEDRLTMKDGDITIDYMIKVQKPKRPLATEIKSYKITKHPRYEHTEFIES